MPSRRDSPIAKRLGCSRARCTCGEAARCLDEQSEEPCEARSQEGAPEPRSGRKRPSAALPCRVSGFRWIEISMRGYVNTENQKNTSCGIFRLGRKPLPRRLVTSFLSALCSGSMPGCLLRSVFGLPLSSRTLSPNLTTQSPGRGVGCLRNGFRALGGVPVKRRVPTRRGRPPWRRFSRQARRRTPCRTSAWRA